MNNTLNVAMLGATGESGGLILEGLLQSQEPKGVRITAIDLNGSEEELSKSLKGIDIVIASVPPNALDTQLPLARAAKKAGVKRFVPAAYAMAVDPNGISTAQKNKEKIYIELEKIAIPHTIIDVGWWHFGFVPRLPSGATDYAIALPDFLVNLIPEDGNMQTYLVDNRDVGSLVARIIADPRTINSRVMANGDILTINEMYDIAERLSGEKPERRYVSADKLESMIDSARGKIAAGQVDYPTLVGCFWLEYYYSSFIDGDNSPAGAQRLGYTLASDLYPDAKTTSFEAFFADILGHKLTLPYSNRNTS
ncbi:hypothetical protein FDECE_4666 [Fusarium decemcellulare]|nr:hypothetical protein FDECE_4666 [Fusarium decemcellulare]